MSTTKTRAAQFEQPYDNIGAKAPRSTRTKGETAQSAWGKWLLERGFWLPWEPASKNCCRQP